MTPSPSGSRLVRLASEIPDLATELASRAAEEVPAPLFRRHLGLPPGAEEDEATARLGAEASRWFEKHGTPWLAVAFHGLRDAAGARVVLDDGTTWTSELQVRRFRDARAQAAAVLAVTAGAEVEAEIAARWRDERPDEALFLSAFAVAVVEHLRARAIAELRGRLRSDGFVLLDPYSPGYPGWDLSDQERVLGALGDSGPLKLLPSGVLLPARSTLTVCGVAEVEGSLAASRTTEAVPASRRHDDSHEEKAAREGEPSAGVRYAFPARALAKWSRERLVLAPRPDGALAASFRFDGTTCSHLGLPIAIHYELELSVDGEDGDRVHRIQALSCKPAPEDRGHRAMCAYLNDPSGFVCAMREAPPVEGLTLEEALLRVAPFESAGCLCEPAFRRHKWRVVLETVHYRLASRENQGA